MNITNHCNEKNRCTRCGCCCTDFAFISDAEIRMIKTYLKAHPEIKEQWARPINGRVPILCPFLNDREHKCNIYKVRPKICKLFKCNKSEIVLTEIKKQFSPEKYHNVTNARSWHLIFFGNPLQQNALMHDNEEMQK